MRISSTMASFSKGEDSGPDLEPTKKPISCHDQNCPCPHHKDSEIKLCDCQMSKEEIQDWLTRIRGNRMSMPQSRAPKTPTSGPKARIKGPIVETF